MKLNTRTSKGAYRMSNTKHTANDEEWEVIYSDDDRCSVNTKGGENFIIWECDEETAERIVKDHNTAEAKDKRIALLEGACKLAKTAISDKNRQERMDSGNLIAQSIESIRGMSAEDQIEKAFLKLQDVLANKGASL